MDLFKLYRNNFDTWRKFNKISNENIRRSKRIPSETYVKYAPGEAFSGKEVLNIGCGRCVYRTPNVVNVDVVKGDGVNLVWDLSKTPIPLESDRFDLVIANHVLEHVPNWFECFKELARVVRPGGKIEVWVPPISSDSSFGYRDHINSIGLTSFTGTNSMGRNSTNLSADEELKSLGDVPSLEIIAHQMRPIVTWWTMFAPEFVLRWMGNHLRNVISEEGFMFRKMVKNVPV